MEDNIKIAVSAACLVLAVVGRWLLFRKAGKPGWHSIIPILNLYDEYDMCWKGSKIFLLALLTAAAGGFAVAAEEYPFLMGGAAVAVLGVLIINWKQSMRLAASFGKGGGVGFLLFLTGDVGRVILGLSGAEYVGKPRR